MALLARACTHFAGCSRLPVSLQHRIVGFFHLHGLGQLPGSSNSNVLPGFLARPQAVRSNKFHGEIHPSFRRGLTQTARADLQQGNSAAQGYLSAAPELHDRPRAPDGRRHPLSPGLCLLRRPVLRTADRPPALGQPGLPGRGPTVLQASRQVLQRVRL